MPAKTKDRAAVSGWVRREVRELVERDVDDPRNEFETMSDVVNAAVRERYGLTPTETA